MPAATSRFLILILIVITIEKIWHTNPSRLNSFTRNTPTRCKCDCCPARTDLKRIIREPTVNRPGLALSGFTRYFAYKRMQVMGNAEMYYLRSLSRTEREARYADLFAYKIPVHRVQPRSPAGQGISDGGGQGGRADFSDAAGHDEIHQLRHASRWR